MTYSSLMETMLAKVGAENLRLHARVLRAIFDNLPDRGLGAILVRRDFADEVYRRWCHLTRAQFRDLRRRAQLTARAQQSKEH